MRINGKSEVLESVAPEHETNSVFICFKETTIALSRQEAIDLAIVLDACTEELQLWYEDQLKHADGPKDADEDIRTEVEPNGQLRWPLK